MKGWQWALVGLVCIGIFMFVYYPHVSYSLPFHVDEWHHISEAIRLENGEYIGGSFGYRVGFHVFLLMLGKFVSLIDVYEFLPAIWAVFGSLIVFYIVERKSRNYFLGIFAMVFYGSLRWNVNLTGMGFFTPLTFSLPFILLFMYLFGEGILWRRKEFILWSLIIMSVLVFVHSISVLFALPILIVYCLFNWNYVRDEWKLFSLFLIVPVLGLGLYSLLNGFGIIEGLVNLLGDLKFAKGWGITELDNSLLEVYSGVGLILALVGFIVLLVRERTREDYLLYLIWPVVLFIELVVFGLFGFSYLSPYQRNLYYFALSLPILSSFGLGYVLGKVGQFVNRSEFDRASKEFILNGSRVIIVVLVFAFAFNSYYDINKGKELYELVSKEDVLALEYLSGLEAGKVLAELDISMGVYAISGKEVVGSLYFYGDRNKVRGFFEGSCIERDEIIKSEGVRFVVVDEKNDCGWDLIYEEGGRYIYEP